MIVDITSSSIQLTWEPPPLEYHNGMIVSYTILCIEQQESDEILTIYSTMTTDITINQLHPYYTYSCKVSAVTVSQGPFSDSINITTLEDGMSHVRSFYKGNFTQIMYRLCIQNYL